MLNIKENITSSPMLFVSRHNNITDKEVNYVQERTKPQYRCAYILSSIIKSHEDFHGPLFSVGTKQRKKRWTLEYIALQAILMSYDQSASLKDRFENARQCLVGMFPYHLRPGKTYQGFVKAIRRIPSEIKEQLQAHLCQQHQQVAGSSWKVHGWIPFAADGSRIETPRTKANQESLGCAGKKKIGPQLLLTTLYHMGSGLPWRWAIGAGTDSEREQLRGMLKTVPVGSLIVADAGFTGYDLLNDIMSHDLSFLIRVGANVTLLKNLGFKFQQQGNIVWLWPQSKRDQNPLKLRLIRLRAKTKHIPKKHDVYLLTNVFDTEGLSDEVAGILYKMRWGVEVINGKALKRLVIGRTRKRNRRPEHPKSAQPALMKLLVLKGVTRWHKPKKFTA